MEWVIAIFCLSIGFIAGNFRRETVENIKALKNLLERKKDKSNESSKSVFIDPMDPIEEARRRYDEQMKDLNP